MSEEMAVTDKGSEDETKLNGDGASLASAASVVDTSSALPSQITQDLDDGKTPQSTDAVDTAEVTDESRGRKRTASSAFSDNGDDGDDFKGFDHSHMDDSTADYSLILERMEAEMSADREKLVRVRNVLATPPAATVRLSKRLRQDTGTDGSRPSSALSSRSDGDGVISSTEMSSGAASPAARRRAPTCMSSPALREPLARGWRRELVYRAALDAHSRRNADIYYYMPSGKKLRSTREVAENLSGTGFTLDNFSFSKEPLGVDDPEKEIIRDAKLMRKTEAVATPPAPSPVPSSVPGKRGRVSRPGDSPAQAPPSAAPPASAPSPPAKIKVKSVGSRLSSGTAATATTPKQPPKKQPAPAPTDNNNTTAWKKPSGPHRTTQPTTHPTTNPTTSQVAPTTAARAPSVEHPPANLQTRGQVQQPCSMVCGGGAVPTLACSACLCLYHPVCVGHVGHLAHDDFLCKNCKRNTSPEAPTMTSRGRGRRTLPPAAAAAAAAVRQPTIPKLTVKLSDVNRRAGVAELPQSRAVLNGRRFIVVPRNIVLPQGQ